MAVSYCKIPKKKIQRSRCRHRCKSSGNSRSSNSNSSNNISSCFWASCVWNRKPDLVPMGSVAAILLAATAVWCDGLMGQDDSVNSVPSTSLVKPAVLKDRKREGGRRTTAAQLYRRSYTEASYREAIYRPTSLILFCLCSWCVPLWVTAPCYLGLDKVSSLGADQNPQHQPLVNIWNSVRVL